MSWAFPIRTTHIIISLLALILFADFTSSSQKCLVNYPEVIPKKYAHFQGQTRTINLEMSNRVTHMLTTHVFQIFLKEVIGYDKVKIINRGVDNFDVEEAILRMSDEKTEIPQTWINLEVWVPPEFDAFSRLLIKECGSVGPPGRFGWFIPENMILPIKNYFKTWKTDIREIHWEFFTYLDNVQPFDIDPSIMETFKKFSLVSPNSTEYYCKESFCEKSVYTPKQCQRNKCAVLLTSYYNSTSFVKSDIDERKLYVKVIWLGDNLNKAITLLKEDYRNKPDKSMIILNWTPSETILHEEDYVSVAFKHCELLNALRTSGCKYEMHRLVKIAWSKIGDFANPLDSVLRAFKFKDDDFRYLLDLYEANHEVKTISEIACEWMNNRYDSWHAWKQITNDIKIYIGGIFPIDSSSYNGRAIVVGAKMARDAINKNNTILPNYDIELLATDGKCKPDAVMRNFIEFIVDSVNKKKFLGVLGPACSDTVEPIAGVSKHYRMMVISYSAEGATFSDRTKYPYFFRTIGENQHYKHVYLELFKHFKWTRVAALTEDGQKYTEYISSMQDELEKNKITFIANKKFPRERESNGMRRYLEDLKNKTARIIIADVVESVARAVMCEAYELGMTAKEGYVWFLPMWLNETWYDTDYFNVAKHEGLSCSTKKMIESITGYFAMTHAYFAPDDSIMQENITVKEWKEKYRIQAKNTTSNYAGFAYDAMWTYAFALDKLNKEDPEALSDLHSEDTTTKLVHLVEKTDFNGVSGRIKFRGGPSRFSVINIVQWYDNQTNLIGHFYPNLTDDKPEIFGGTLNLTGKVQWFTKDKTTPDDGTNIPSSTNACAVESLAKFFNVACTEAIIILNVIVACLGLFLLSVVCVRLKRKYEKKVQLQEDYLKSLGLDVLHHPLNLSDLCRYEVPREKVVINRKIGEGAFGTVYGGEADIPDEGWLPVAVKTLKVGSNPEEKLDFLAEADMMKRFDHKNVIRLLGICTKIEPIYAIMDFMLYGDLKTYLLARRHLVKRNIEESEEVSPKRLTSMALDIARALSYLAEQKYVHRDVASRNCLVNAKRIVKLGDFGMARPMFQGECYRFTRKGMLPVRWMSPESLGLGVFSPASDIWSYGVLLYEIITFGSFPYQGKTNTQVLEHVKNGGCLEVPKGVKVPLETLMKNCWKQDTKDRPAASAIVEFLAMNPRLMEPCLDVPISSVEIEDSEPVDIGGFPEFRKCSTASFKSSPQNGLSFNIGSKREISRQQSESTGVDSGVSIPMENCCPKEPLLGHSRSTSSLINFSKYVTIQHNMTDSGCQDEDDYVKHSPPNGHVVTKV